MSLRKKNRNKWIAAIIFSAVFISGWKLDYLPERGFKPVARRVAQTKTSLADATFPEHTSVFKFTSFHGSLFLQNQETCKKCHGADLKGGTLQSSCLGCHPVFGVWQHFGATAGDGSTSHGEQYLKNARYCTGCHGPEGEGKNGAPSCKDCHSYPHGKDWTQPAEHGKAYLADKNSPLVLGCLDCHGNNPKALACSSCHINLPHPKPWVPIGHGSSARDPKNNCFSCHIQGKRLIPKYKDSCWECHAWSAPGGKNSLPIIKWEAMGSMAKALSVRKPASESFSPEETWISGGKQR